MIVRGITISDKESSKRNFAVFAVLDRIATLTTHIPNKGEQLVRYYGYSAMFQGEREKKRSRKNQG